MRRGVVALLILAFIAGCGGTSRLSKEDFVERADSICRNFEQAVDTLDPPSGRDDVPRYVDEVVPIVDGGLTRLRALAPPTEIEPLVGEWIASVTESRDLLEQLGIAARAKDDAKFLELDTKSVGLDDRSDLLGRQLGLVDCAND